MLRLHYACHCGLAWRREISDAAPAIGDRDRCLRCHADHRPHWYETVSLPQGSAVIGAVRFGAVCMGLAASVGALVWRWPALVLWAGM